MGDVRIGIDFGTCYSNVAYHDQHGVHFIQDPAALQRTDSIPSSVLLRADDSFVFGVLAESAKNTAPEGYQRQFKRDLGSKVPYRLRDRKVSAGDLTAKFLEFLVGLTATNLGAKPTGAVITVPAAYDPFRRSIVEDAARHAGLAGISLIAEPVAAIIGAAEGGEITGDTTVLVYDLGGGTFDAAVVRLEGSKQQVLGAKGLPDFGGTDIDILIEQDFVRKAGAEFAEIVAGQDSDDPKLVARAMRTRIAAQEFCRNIKHQLSSTDRVSDLFILQFDYELSREKLEDMVRPELDRTVSTCGELLAGIALTPEQIDTVLLVGGGSYMPLVGEVVATELGRPVKRTAYPELAVCMGAAILARTEEFQVLASRASTPPPVRKLAEDLGISLAELAGSGPDNSITRDDVRRAAKRQTDKPHRPQVTVEGRDVSQLFTLGPPSAAGRARAPEGSRAGDEPTGSGSGQQVSPPAPRDVSTDPGWIAALEAFYAGRWQEAVEEFEALQQPYPGDWRVQERLQTARRERDLASWSAEADAAAERGDWAHAIVALERIAAVDTTYRDVGSRLEHARSTQRRQSLLDEIIALYRARRWKAVLAAGEQLHQIDPGQPDPGGMLAEARQQLADEDIADRYADGLRLLEAGEHESAATVFAAIEQERPGYRDATSLLAAARGALPTRVVAKSGGHHTTIAAAITASAAGDQILIKPGEYDESLTIDKDVQIHGDGRVEEITVRAAGTPVIYLRTGRAQISNLTIRRAATQDTQPESDKLLAAVQIEGGQPVVQGCDISSHAGSGIVIQGNADPAVRANRIHDNKQTGVVVWKQGRGTIEDNDISANTFNGVEVGSGGDPAVRANRIHDNKLVGVNVYEQGRGTIEDNDISANTFNGVQVGSGADPAVRANRIHDNKKHGVLVLQQGRGTFEDNDISANTLSGVAVGSGGDPAVRANRIHDNNQDGIVLETQGRGTIEDNDISANAFYGVEVRSGGDPAVRANRIHDNKKHGVLVLQQGRGTFEDNDISANTLSGVAVGSGGDPAVRANRIHDNKKHGVLAWNQGRGTIEDNDISANTLSGVEVNSKGDPAVRANRIHDNKKHGVLAWKKGRGTFEDNDIFANAGSGVEVKSEGSPAIVNNRIHKNRSSGIVVSWTAGRGTITGNNIFSNMPGNLKVSSAAPVTQRENRTAD